jgi:CRP-like cAMP-binding protein
MRTRIPKKEIDLLGQVSLFAGCSQAELRSIAQFGSAVYPVPGIRLTKQGEPGQEFFLVVDGEASCKVGSKEVARFTAGSYFGELALLFNGYRTATVESLTDMELLVLDAREFRSMLMTNPSIGIKMLARLAERLADADANFSI